MILFLAIGTWSFANIRCRNGVERHISYGGPYCGETYTAAIAHASIQWTILRLQNPDDVIYFKTVAAYQHNGQWCLFVEFIRCVPNVITDIGGASPSTVEKYLRPFAEIGFVIEDFQVLKNGFTDLELVNEDGLRFLVMLDPKGAMIEMMEVK